jgi:tetratricopeptide (TPR) repeat protein
MTNYFTNNEDIDQL